MYVCVIVGILSGERCERCGGVREGERCIEEFERWLGVNVGGFRRDARM